MNAALALTWTSFALVAAAAGQAVGVWLAMTAAAAAGDRPIADELRTRAERRLRGVNVAVALAVAVFAAALLTRVTS